MIASHSGGRVATLLAVAALVSVSCSGDGSNASATTTTAALPPTTGSSPSTSPSTTQPPPASVTTGASADAGWQLVELPTDGLPYGPTFGDSPIAAVAAGPPQLVAVGSVVPAQPPGGDERDRRPAVWTSTDGAEWVPVIEGFAGESGAIRDVTWHDTGFVAVGSSDDDAAAWVSEDGRAWSRVLVSSARPDGLARMEAVVAVAGGVFAAGYEVYPPTGQLDTHSGEDFDAAVWWSADGTDWQRIEDPVFGTPGYQPNAGGEFNGQIVGAAEAPWGVLFAGTASPSDPGADFPEPFSAVWVLREEWERVDLGTGDQIVGVAAGDGATAAAGWAVVYGAEEASPTADAVFLVSADGVTWERAVGAMSGLGSSDGIQFVRDVTYLDGVGWVGVGSDEKEFSSIGAAAVWTADDSAPLDWRREIHDDAVFGELRTSPLLSMSGVAGWGDRVAVVGTVALTVPRSDGGAMCCEYVPVAWVLLPG